MYKKISIILVVILLLGACTFAIWNNSKKPTEEEQLKEKLNEEILYLSDKLINIGNKLNNISIEEFEIVKEDDKEKNNTKENSNEGQSNNSSTEKDNSSKTEDNSSSSSNSKEKYSVEEEQLNTDELDWDSLQNSIEDIYMSWSEIIIDISKKGNNNNIAGFSKDLDQATKYIESKDKQNSLIMISKLYQYLPEFMKSYEADNKQIALINTKSKIINAYSLIEQENWDEIKNQTESAINEFNAILNDVKNNKNQYNINKTYILLNEFKNSIDTNDKKILYIKYKNLIEEIKQCQ